MVIFISIVLIIVIIPAVLILKKALKARSAEEGRVRRQRLAYQPSAKPVWVPSPVPISRQITKQQPVAAPIPEVNLLEDCQNIQQSLLALAGKYSLDSFTIATSDGLVFASSGSSTAQEDAAIYSWRYNGREPAGMALFSVNHKGSELKGIVRSQEIISGETQKCIESDIKDILNKWI
jgi:hypothetical protein